MRKFFVASFCGLIALVGFAGTSSASATIDLIWANSGTSTTSIAASSTSIVLQVILTAGPGGSQGAGVSVDYGSVAGLSVIGYASTPGGELPLALGVTSDTGTRVQNVNSGALPPFVGNGLTAAGQTHQLGTITFDVSALAAGSSFILTSDANGPTDGVLDLAGTNISATTTFNGATINTAPVPEPGTLSLLGMGLGGLYVVGRRSSRKR